MKCRDCKFLSDPHDFNMPGRYEVVRCTLGLWDTGDIKKWYSWGSTVLNRGAVRRLGEACAQGQLKGGPK